MTRGYIVIPNWDTFQHYKDRRPAWVKLHLDLLGNDAWLDLSAEDRCLLITIWMLVGRYGNGRVNASLRWLQAQANLPLSNRYRGLERLNHAGFIQFSASPLPAPAASPEKEGSKEPKKEETRASASQPRAADVARVPRKTTSPIPDPDRDDDLNRRSVAAALEALGRKTA